MKLLKLRKPCKSRNAKSDILNTMSTIELRRMSMVQGMVVMEVGIAVSHNKHSNKLTLSRMQLYLSKTPFCKQFTNLSISHHMQPNLTTNFLNRMTILDLWLQSSQQIQNHQKLFLIFKNVSCRNTRQQIHLSRLEKREDLVIAMANSLPKKRQELLSILTILFVFIITASPTTFEEKRQASYCAFFTIWAQRVGV